MVKTMSIDDKCTHPYVTPVGIQQGVKNVPSFPLGNCYDCGTTINMNLYVSMSTVWYKGQRLYRKTRFNRR